MTGIFQIFDRYKSKALVKSERRKSNSGESKIKTIPTYYLVEEDGIARKAAPDASDRRSEASRDSRRSSSADISDVVVKTLTSSKEPPPTTGAVVVQEPQKPGLSASYKSASPLATTPEGGSLNIDPENYSSDCPATPKPAVPSRVDNNRSRDGHHKLPPRDTRSASKFSAHKNRSRTPAVENGVSVHIDNDARDISRAIWQMRESAYNKSPFVAREARRHLPSVVQRYHHSSGDEQDGGHHRYQSSDDEKDGHPQRKEARRYSSAAAAESFEEELYDDDDDRDHHRPQFPFEGKEFLRSWPHNVEGRRNPSASAHVREILRYMSSGDEMDLRSNMSSGDERGVLNRLYRDGHRQQRASRDQESNRSHWPVERGGTQRFHSDAFGGSQREESSGDESVVAAQRPHPRRRHHHHHHHHHQGSADDRHKSYSASRDSRGEGRRRGPAYDAGREPGQGLQSSGDERGYMPTRDPHRRHSSTYYAGYKHAQSAAEHPRYQSAGDSDQGHGYRHPSSPSRPSTSGLFDGCRYQSCGDDRYGGHRNGSMSADRGRHRDTSSCNSWRNESSDDGRHEVFPQRHRSSAREEDHTRRASSATKQDHNAHLRYSVGNDDDDRHRYNSASHDDRRRDRSRPSIRDGAKLYEEHGRVRSSDRDWVYEDASVASAAAFREGHRRNASVESRGEGHRRRGSSTSVVAHNGSGGEARVAKPKARETGYSCDLPPRSSSGGSRNTVSPRNLIDIRDLARLHVQVRESSSQTPARRDNGYKSATIMAPELVSAAESVTTGSYDFREMLRAVDFKDAQWTSAEKLSSTRNSVDGRDPPRMSNASRVSIDSRQYQSSTPRRSVDGREHQLRASSLHSSRASSVDAQAQLRTNSMDNNSSSTSTTGELKWRGPSVVARLMGLAELPEKDDNNNNNNNNNNSNNNNNPSDRPPQALREGKSLQRLLSATPSADASPSDRGKTTTTQLHLSEVAQQMKQVAARLHQDSQRQKTTTTAHALLQSEARPKRKPKAKSRTQSRSRSPPSSVPVQLDSRGYGIVGRQEPGSPIPRQPMSPKHHQMEGMPNAFKKRRPQELAPSSGDLDQRLHQLRIRNSIQEHRTLKQILEAMHLKGLLHPKPPKSSSSPTRTNEHAREAEWPLQHDFVESKPSSSNVVRANRNEYQEQLNFEDLIRMDGEALEEATLDGGDHSQGEASIVVMKPVNYMTPSAAATDDVVDGTSDCSEAAPREKVEIGHRRRGSERRAGGSSSSSSSSSSGGLSRSHSLEPPSEQSKAAEKAQAAEELSFAKVMMSWRERIAADAAKKATTTGDVVAEVRPQPRSGKSSALKHRPREATSPNSKHETRNNGAALEGDHAAAASSANIISLPDLATQGNADHDDEDGFIAKTASEGLAAGVVEAFPERVPAQVAVLRSKRAPGKPSRSKEKLRGADLRSNSTTATTPSVGSKHLETPTDQLAPSPEPNLNDDSKITSPGADSTAHEEEECTSPSLKASEDDSSRMTPKLRRIIAEEPGVVVCEQEEVEEECAPPASEVTLEVDVQGVSNEEEEEEDRTRVGELAPLQCCTPVAECEAEELAHDAMMEEAFDDNTSEAHTPEGFPTGRDKCFSEDGAFALLQGADHPSPVSVLDSPIFQEGFHLEELSTSPDSVKSLMVRHDEDAENAPEHDVACDEHVEESEVVTPRTADPLRDMYTKVARSIELGEKEMYRGHADLRIPFTTDATTTTTSEAGDLSQGKLYVQGILEESGLSDGASALVPGDAAEIMEFDVFTRKEEELQTAELERIDRGELEKSEETRYKESLDRRLMFDCMNEVLERKMGRFLNPQPWGAPVVVRSRPCGQRLVDDVWDELRDMHWPTSAAYDALYALLQKDFTRKGSQWLDFSAEVGDVGRELEVSILQELVEEVVQDVTRTIIIPPCKSIVVKRQQQQQQQQQQPLPPSSPASSSPRAPTSEAPSEATSETVSATVASDDSELRRRSLLDKTRKDLLAWHVQYQQL